MDTYHLGSEQTQDQQYCLTKAHLLLTAAIPVADGRVQDQLWVCFLHVISASHMLLQQLSSYFWHGGSLWCTVSQYRACISYWSYTCHLFFFSYLEKRCCALKGEREAERKRTEVALRLNISSILNCKRSKQYIWPLKNNEVEAWVVFSVLCKYLSPGVESPASIPDGPFHSGTPQNWAGLATSGTNTRGKFSVLENL